MNPLTQQIYNELEKMKEDGSGIDGPYGYSQAISDIQARLPELVEMVIASLKQNL